MNWTNSLLAWLLVVGQPGSQASDDPAWAMPLAFVAAVVFILILLSGFYLIFLALKQRKREDEAEGEQS